MRFSPIVALAASLSTAAAVQQGFNYGATKADGSFNFEADFKSLFQSAKNLVGTSGFTSARLYTMIQGGSSTNEPTQAIQAAIDTDTSLLLGVWASAGQGPLSAEITALKSAIAQYGDKFAKLVVGISVGSEDLYRASPTGKLANAGIGADAATIASYIAQVRDAIKGTSLAAVPVGHVDTWTAWTEGDVNAVINSCDFIGMDAYPYFQNTMANSISDGKSLFNAALAATQAAVGGKPVWITETGYPVSGKTENLAVPGLENAKTYWDEVGCPLFGSVNTWWYTLQDSNGATPNPSFGIIGSSYGTTPLYDLSCKNASSSGSAGSQSSTKNASAVSGSVAGGNGTASGSTAGTYPESSLASAASSISSAAAGGHVVSSGSGLSPSQGAGYSTGNNAGSGTSYGTGNSAGNSTGNGSGYGTGNGNGTSPSASITATGSSSSATGASGSNGTVTTGSLSSAASKTASGASRSSSAVSANGASALSGSFVGALGAIFVAVASL